MNQTNVILKLKMIAADITQKELAKRCGISESTLSLIVRGKTDPTLRTAQKIAKALQTSVDELWPLNEEDTQG